MPAQSKRPLWSLAVLWICAAVLALSLVGVVVGELTSEDHGYLIAQQFDHPYLWVPLGAAAVGVALMALLRWRWMTLIATVCSIGAIAIMVPVFYAFIGVGRGTPVTSPDGKWAVRVDNRGFQDPLYAIIGMERGGLASRYWIAGQPFGTDDAQQPKEDFSAPVWTSNDTFQLTSTRRTFTYRMTADGPVKVS